MHPQNLKSFYINLEGHFFLSLIEGVQEVINGVREVIALIEWQPNFF